MPAARGASQQGLSTVHIAMIVFVILWLISTGLLVWVYTDQEKVKLDSDRSKADNRRLQDENNGYKEKIGILAEFTTGDRSKDQTAIVEIIGVQTGKIKEEGLVANFSDSSVNEQLSSLYAAYAAKCGENDKLLAQNDQLNQKVQDLTAANEEERTRFANALEEMKGDMEKLEKSWDEFRLAKNEQVDSFDNRIEEVKQQMSEDVREQQNNSARLVSQNKELTQRLERAETLLGESKITPIELQTARQPDGVILTAQPGENVVYINLGKDDHLALGQSFAVYSASTGIPADGVSKGRIEIVSIYDGAAACRVVESHATDPIREGDIIGNPVYDRNNPLRFVLAGYFDLNHDGRPDRRGTEQVEGMIEDWNGIVEDKVSALVDFVVVGARPTEIRPSITKEMTPELEERMAEAAEAIQRYDEVLETANSLGIPVMPQSVFLHFLGYRGTDDILAGTAGSR